ncbi:putative methyltransferase PMT24 [Morus notabilis]|uniref:Methyltransferase n=1 Tax=Morus notabilis TaxID=981085 RepID=W9S9L2_9ROSA|nr:probable methyltransferase PMT24 [Morus notabilis]EXC32448.1 putative methyltransferase PMT24 [Morus notabilis]
MALGKYTRVEGRKSSNCCSTISVVVFVAFCLVGIWVFMSSTVPDEDQEEVPSLDNTVNDVTKQHVVADDNPKQFEDTSGDESQTSEGSQEETPISVEVESASDSNEKRDESERAESEEIREEIGDETKQISLPFADQENVEQKTHQEGSDSHDNVEEPEAKGDIEASELLKETRVENNGGWSTQAVESQNEKRSQHNSISNNNRNGISWRLCNVTAGPDYIPCLDNWEAIRNLPSTKHYEHRERHCPDEPPTCLVPLPEGYKRPVKWPTSRDKIWYNNVPHIKLAKVKGHQNWVKASGEYLTFPGGGTQFKNGALYYIDFIQKTLPNIAWGKRSRVILDVGCGVASFGGYLFERDVLTMSLAPKDEHEAQVQFALERGIPAISAVMGTKRLPLPGAVFDIVHCARCRVPWHIEGGKLLLELDRVLRPGGYFVWSATPVYQSLPEDVEIWKAMTKLTKSMCWDQLEVKRDKLNEVAAAIYRKPTSNKCYSNRPENKPPLCSNSDDQNAAWNVPLEACLHKMPEEASKRGSRWPNEWPLRLEKPPYWLKSEVGVYGKAAPEDFAADYKRWKNVVSESYLEGMGISWSSVRNVMDMRAVYGGFAAALKDLKVWVMNVVPIDSPDTLPIIYERGLFGIYHDWCESFSTYPRSYDLLHADHLFSLLKKRCELRGVIAEVDRILRPDGTLIVRDGVKTVNEVENMAKSLKWNVRLVFSNNKEALLCVQKTIWRPKQTETIFSAIA